MTQCLKLRNVTTVLRQSIALKITRTGTFKWFGMLETQFYDNQGCS